MIDLSPIRARLEKASPEPWYFECEWRGESFPNLYRLDCSLLDYGMDGEEGIYIRRKEDVEFLNSVRKDIPALLDEVEALREELFQWKSAHGKCELSGVILKLKRGSY